MFAKCLGPFCIAYKLCDISIIESLPLPGIYCRPALLAFIREPTSGDTATFIISFTVGVDC